MSTEPGPGGTVPWAVTGYEVRDRRVYRGLWFSITPF